MFVLISMLRINWVNYERNPYCSFWEIQFQRKNVSYFRSTIGRGRGSWIAYFFGSNHSLIVIVCNCDESFCVWLTEIMHSSNFLKPAICVRDFQGIVRDYLKPPPFFWVGVSFTTTDGFRLIRPSAIIEYPSNNNLALPSLNSISHWPLVLLLFLRALLTFALLLVHNPVRVVRFV